MAEVSGAQFFNYFIFLLVPFFFGLMLLQAFRLLGIEHGIILGNAFKGLVAVETVSQLHILV